MKYVHPLSINIKYLLFIYLTYYDWIKGIILLNVIQSDDTISIMNHIKKNNADFENHYPLKYAVDQRPYDVTSLIIAYGGDIMQIKTC